MKYLQRYLSLLFALVMCVGLFSITAHAETLQNYDIALLYRLYHPDNQKEWRKISTTFTNGEKYLFEPESVANVPMDYNMQGTFRITVSSPDGSYLAKEGETFKFSITGLHLAFIVGDSYFPWKYTPDSIDVALVYDDGTWEYLYDVDWSYSSGTETHAIKIETTAKHDVRKIQFRESTQQYKQTGMHGIYGATIVAGDSRNPTAIEVDIESQEAGLLKDIGNKLTEGFTNLFTAILELPQKLWELISDGLKSLFVPSEESMTAYKSKWEELLSSRFGAVYQVVNIITDSWDGIMQADETNTIEFPQATINFSSTPYTFGGYSVKIVPDGFEVLVTAIKSIVAIVCTVAFINGLRKRYDEIMGVEQ